MTAKVVDASVLAAILFGEPEGAQAAAAIEGADLIAPHLLRFEIANIAVKKARRAPQLVAHLSQVFELLDRTKIDYAPVGAHAAAELALLHGLSAYDASYLWLSRDRGAELVTFDQRLHAAARAPGPN